MVARRIMYSTFFFFFNNRTIKIIVDIRDNLVLRFYRFSFRFLLLPLRNNGKNI